MSRAPETVETWRRKRHAAARKALRGRRIVDVDIEPDEAGDGEHLLLVLDDGGILSFWRDPEQNGPGAVFHAGRRTRNVYLGGGL